MPTHPSSAWEATIPASGVFPLLHNCKAKRKIRIIPETRSTQESMATAKQDFYAQDQ